MENNKITTTANPVSDKDLSRKKYVDDELNKKIDKTGGHFSGDIFMAANTHIHNAGGPEGPNNLVNKGWVDGQLNNKLTKSGGILSGDVVTGQYQITTNRDPAFNDNLARKLYVDKQDNLRVLKVGDTMTGNLNIGNNKILTTADPTNNNDLTRKAYVDKFLKKTGGIMLGNIDLGNNKITTSSDPTNNNDLVRKSYVDGKISTSSVGGNNSGNYLLKSGGTMTGDIVMGNNQVTTTADPVDNNDMVKKKYIDDQNNLYMLIRGGSFNGNVNMNGNFISATYTPSNSNHLTTKSYVDKQDGKKLNTSGGIMTGDINMNGNEIYNVKNIDSSSQGHHIANKEYVDTLVDRKKVETESKLKNVSYKLNIIESYILNSNYSGFFECYDDTSRVTYSPERCERWLNQCQTSFNDFVQSSKYEKPLFRDSLILRGQKCLHFDGNRDSMTINESLDKESGKPHIFTIFLVFSTNSITTNRDIFGNAANHNTNEYYGIKYLNDSNNVNKFCIFQSGLSYIEIENDVYPIKASTKVTNKLMCVSVQYVVDGHSTNNTSSLWVNGKLIKKFTSSSKSSGNINTFTLGHRTERLTGQRDRNHMLYGEVHFCSLVKHRFMKDKEITIQHYLLCNRYGIDFDDSAFNVI